MKNAQSVSPTKLVALFFASVVQVTYRSPFGAAAAAGKLFTRNLVFRTPGMSAKVETDNGLLHVAPPSVDFTT